MAQTFLYIGGSFFAGFLIAWIIRSISVSGLKKALKSTSGFLESERLVRERFQKENRQLHDIKETLQMENTSKIQELKSLNQRLDEDILLLQKSNEETEALLEAGLPVVHSLKLKLIEAQNTIARYKSQQGMKV